MGKYINRSVFALLGLISFGYGAPAFAGTSLLSAADQAQLSAWLGEGQIKLTNIYTKAAGDTSVQFHAAVDGKGRTFSVMEASNGQGQTWLVGGYDPQSWSTKGTFNITLNQSDRTGFLFNLTNGSKHQQTPKSFSADTMGAYQTFNHIDYGPTFGAGNDLYVAQDMTHGLSLMYSYIDENGVNYNTSLLDGTPYLRPNVTYGAIQVYSIAAVPEPASVLMLLAGLGALALVRRRQAV